MMESILGHSKACCNIPPVISHGYVPKGKYDIIDGLRTYVTGPATGKKAILLIYDIFGFFPQTLQGADILASSSSSSSSSSSEAYQVFIPDFFDGHPADISWYPPITPSQQASMYAWFPTRMPDTGIARVPAILAAIQEVYGEKTWGAVGFCWGGKVVAVVSGEDTPFKAACQAHPGLMDAADAARISIPTCLLGSEEESEEEIEKWAAELRGEKYVERFGEMKHGFMSARADLEDEVVRGEYERGYKIFLEFFAKHL